MQLLKAVEKEMDNYEFIQKSISMDNISKRSTEDAKSLTEILQDFKNTRDAISTNFEWKFYNIDEYRNKSRAVPIQPEIRNISDSADMTYEQVPKCSCKWEIISITMGFGALAVIAYVIFKILSCKKRNRI